jgi:asparagine synthase (glutamine-hydrolysing)
VADQYKTEHHEIQMEISVGDLLEQMAQIYDEPFADSSNIPAFLISQYARRYVKVVLSGDGGDEVFGGYQWYEYLMQTERSKSLSWNQKIFGRLMKRASRRVAENYRQQNVKDRLANIKARYPDMLARHWSMHTDLMSPREKYWESKYASSNITQALQGYTSYSTMPGLDRVVEFDAKCYLPGDILVKVDRAALANGLETRSPFLDVDLVEFIWGLPAQMRFSEKSTKPLLRQAFDDLWPAELKGRPKQGFGAPINAWLQRPDVNSLVHRVSRKGGALNSLLPGIPSGLTGLSPQQAWTVLSLGLWLEEHSDALFEL